MKEILGQGTFAQVAKCWSPETNKYAAVKVIKNHPAYYRQAWVEISILKAVVVLFHFSVKEIHFDIICVDLEFQLNEIYDADDQHHIVRMLDCFVHQRHLCISFEMLGSNL